MPESDIKGGTVTRRTLIVGVLLMVLLVGTVRFGRWYFVRSTEIMLPPTAGEPMTMRMLAPSEPVHPPVVAPVEPAPAALATPEPAPVEPALAPRRAKSFWGNRGYVIKDRQSTYKSPAQLELLKRDFQAD